MGDVGFGYILGGTSSSISSINALRPISGPNSWIRRVLIISSPSPSLFAIVALSSLSWSGNATEKGISVFSVCSILAIIFLIISCAEDRFYFEPFSSLSSEYLVHFTRLMETYQAEEEAK